MKSEIHDFKITPMMGVSLSQLAVSFVRWNFRPPFVLVASSNPSTPAKVSPFGIGQLTKCAVEGCSVEFTKNNTRHLYCEHHARKRKYTAKLEANKARYYRKRGQQQ